MAATRRPLGYPGRKATLGLLLGVLAWGGCAHASDSIGPEGIIGEKARVRLAGTPQPYTGILHKLDGDTATIGTETGSLLPIALSPSVRLEISRGTRSNALKGAGIGALVGGVAYALLGAAACDGSDLGGGWHEANTPGKCAAEGALIGSGLGAVVGFIAGSRSRTERWAEVDWEP